MTRNSFVSRQPLLGAAQRRRLRRSNFRYFSAPMNTGGLATFAAMRRASSRVSRFIIAREDRAPFDLWAKMWGGDGCRQNYGDSSGSYVNGWRRGRDSNPRYGCPYAAFRVRCIQPLCHLSKSLEALTIWLSAGRLKNPFVTGLHSECLRTCASVALAEAHRQREGQGPPAYREDVTNPGSLRLANFHPLELAFVALTSHRSSSKPCVSPASPNDDAPSRRQSSLVMAAASQALGRSGLLG